MECLELEQKFLKGLERELTFLEDLEQEQKFLKGLE